MADSTRVKRLAGQIRQEVAMILQTKLQDRRLGLITITDVRVTKDLGYADIYVTFLTTEDQSGLTNKERVAVLKKASGFIRAELSAHLKLRSTPTLRFHFDEVSERGPRLEHLINQAQERRTESE